MSEKWRLENLHLPSYHTQSDPSPDGVGVGSHHGLVPSKGATNPASMDTTEGAGAGPGGYVSMDRTKLASSSSLWQSPASCTPAHATSIVSTLAPPSLKGTQRELCDVAYQ
ncbi:hypothetical protein KIPB_004357 [Kipferlia bialata]|uniref:Uncharacterized protein n=1 Tax=Kipferlia bialata TaxID=797122 RepID=A0A391NKR8_9EUKA|nr:hypothetical protein KIPB_004357 [Kipferlia bialata]|eukprot:g4357.t1